MQRLAEKAKTRLVTYGCNVSGALGRGELGRTGLNKPEVVPTPEDDPPVQVVAGWGHTAFITDSGKLVAFGRAFDMRNVLRFGKLANSRPAFAYFWTKYLGASGSVDFPEPTLVSSDVKCIKVTASASLTGALTGEGDAIAFGANRYGQTGIALTQQDTQVFRPTSVKRPNAAVKWIDIAAGHQNMCAVDENGEIYAWGKSDRGQVGGGEDTAKSSPIRLPKAIPRFDQDGVKAVSCGFSHCLALTNGGRVYSWGKGQGPQGKSDVLQPRLVKGLPPIVEIACGQYHNVARSIDGDVYQWGLLPSDMGGDFIAEPRKISGIPKDATSLACGVTESSILHEGTVYSWTWKEPRARPLSILADFNVRQVSFGWRHTAVLVE